MATDILMPKMGESVQEGTILRWLKGPGDRVERDEIIAEISTDKVDTEIPSSEEGTLIEILAQEGDTVEVGTVIARLGTEEEAGSGDSGGGESTEAKSEAEPAAEEPAAEEPAAAEAESQPGEGESREASVADEVTAEAEEASGDTPAAEAESSTDDSGEEEAGSGGERHEIVMPKMGESVQEGTILRWLKQPGDTIERDEIIAEISTDKVDTEIPSSVEGTLQEIVAQEGDTVEVGKVIAYIGSGFGGGSAPAKKSTEGEKKETAAKGSDEQKKPSAAPAAPTQNGAQNGKPAPAPAGAEAANGGPIPRMSNGRFYSPLVRTVAQEEGVSVAELDTITGTGAGGRVTKGDLTSWLSNRTERPAAKTAAPAAEPQKKTEKGAPATPARPAETRAAAPAARSKEELQEIYGDNAEIVPMDRMRQLIAEHMVRSKATSPHVTEVGEADVSGLVRLREGEKEGFLKREGIKLTYTPFFVAAVARALRENPWVNASVEGTNVIVKKHVNVGVATALPDGNLIVPVIKDADRMNITGLAHAVSDLANRARNKELSPDDIAGGTFTLTNYGVFNLLHGAPIISQPQAAILGTGAIQKRPVVREIDGQDMIVIRSMIYLSLSHDHRIIDGLLGGKFLADIITNLERFDTGTML